MTHCGISLSGIHFANDNLWEIFSDPGWISLREWQLVLTYRRILELLTAISIQARQLELSILQCILLEFN